MKKRKFGHWNKVEFHSCFLNLYHVIKTDVYKVSAMAATELKKYGPFFLLIMQNTSSKIQLKAIQMMLSILIMRTEDTARSRHPSH